MKRRTTNSRQLDILGNGLNPSAQEILTATLKRCRQNLAYFSIFATLPALLLPNIHEARTEDIKRTGAIIPEGKAKLRQSLKAGKTSDLLKRQSKFRLPHQTNFNPAFAGSDDCPGRAIQGGSYPAAAPYIEVGDTTGANNTVNAFYCYSCFYLTVNTPGPDHIYSFILTDRGPNPKIEVSTTAAAAAFSPIIYVLEGGFQDSCPAGTGGFSGYGLMFADTTASRVATINSQSMNWLPLNVPLYLLVDSRGGDAGSYTLRIQDVTIAPAPSPNQIDGSEFFVRQHYRDFLNREPDPEGLAFWTKQITSCGGDQGCIEVNRINDSGSFFLSIEFQETGYLAYRLYKTAYGNLPNAPVPITFSEFTPDTQAIGRDVIVRQSGWEQVLENNKRAFTMQFVERPRFTTAFPPAMSAQEFVDKLNANAGNPLSQTERDQLISDLSGGKRSRAEVLRAIAENPKLVQAEFNRAFVLMQYFGYLRRNPNDAPDGNFVGYNFWLDKLNRFNGDFIAAEMVKAFLSSSEYRQRFGP